MGRKVYLMGSFQLSISKQQALLERYNFNLWDSLSKFKNCLPQELRQEFTAILEKSKAVATISLQEAHDAADSAARTMASAVTMRCCS